jgi:HEAT repeat protein
MSFSFLGLFKPNVEKLKVNNDIKGLIEALKYQRDYTIQEKAAKALMVVGKYLGKSILPVLYNALGDQNENVRRNIAKTICAIGADEKGISYLIESLNDECWEVCENGRRSLAELGVKAIPSLTQALKHKSGRIRENAVRTLGMTGSRVALSSLRDALSFPELKERKGVVVEAIGNLGSIAKDAVPQLLDIWNKEPDIRQYRTERILR